MRQRDEKDSGSRDHHNLDELAQPRDELTCGIMIDRHCRLIRSKLWANTTPTSTTAPTVRNVQDSDRFFVRPSVHYPQWFSSTQLDRPNEHYDFGGAHVICIMDRQEPSISILLRSPAMYSEA
jgi:hypothetical protein